MTARDDGTIVAWNPAAARMFGYSEPEAIGQSVATVMPPSSRDDHREGLLRFRGGGARRKVGSVAALTGQRRDGTCFPIELSLSEWRDASGHYATAIIRDTSERQQAHDALRESEAKFRVLTESMKDVIWTLDTDTLRFLYVSPSVEALRGFTPAEILAEPMDAALAPDEAAGLRARMESRVDRLLSSGDNRSAFYTDEVEQPCKDGTTVWTEVVHAYYRNADSGHVEIHAVTRDITERRRAESTLRESEGRFRSVVSALVEGIVLQTADGAITACNASAERILGLTQDQMTGRTSVDPRWRAVHEDGSPFPGEAHPSMVALVTGEPQTGVVMGVHKPDGTLTWISVNAEPLWRPDEPRPYAVVASFTDITAGHQAAARISESDARHRTILATAMDGFWLVELDGRLGDVNETYARMSGYSRQELMTMGVSQLESIETAEAAAAHIAKVVSLGDDRFESRHRRKDGTEFDVEVSVQSSPIDGGRMVVFLRDITQRKLAEEQLRQSEAMLKDAQRVAHVGSWTWHVPDDRLEWTSEMYRIFGISEDSFSGALSEVVAGAIHPDDRAAVEEANRAVIEDRRPAPLQYRVVWPDGSIHVVWAEAGELVLDGAGAPVRLTGIVQDITERVRAAEATGALEAQLQQAQRMESVGRLAGGVAHDFNNMLSAILGNTELALEALGPTDPVNSNLVEIAEAARRSADLTRQLLAFARRQTVVPKVLDLNDAVGRTIDMLRRLIGEDIALVWQPEIGPLPIHMDPSQVDQVLTNLVVNARDAISDVGRITLETGSGMLSADDCDTQPGLLPGEFAVLTVRDNGCGMDAETVSHVFEPFFTTKEAGKGTGLGLATVYGIVTQNGGLITVQSKVGEGTTFRVHLPRHRGQPAPSAPAAAPTAGISPAATILVVEDEPAVLRLTATLLERLGHRVLAAGTPGEAIRLAQEEAGGIDLLITDVVMPEMNGRALARTLLTFNPELQRLFMSGYTADVIAHHGVLDPGVHFIQKPFSASALAAAVRAALEPEPELPDTPAT